MDIIRADPINTREYPTVYRETTSGTTATRWYLVNTRDINLARNALGIPKRGEPFGGDNPLLRVKEVGDFEFFGGRLSSNGTGGSTFVPVLYETPSFGATGGIKPGPGLTHTIISGGVQTFTRYFPVYAEANITPAINNGEGVAVERGETTFEVLTYRNPDQGSVLDRLDGYTLIPYYGVGLPLNPEVIPRYEELIFRLIRLKDVQAVNVKPLRFPPVLGTNVRIRLDIGQARFHDFSLTVEDGLVRQSVVFKVAADWSYYWQPKTLSGKLAGEPIRAYVYPFEDLSGLWPEV